jgi:hypothetical protein
MPTLKIVPKGTSLRKTIPQDVVDQYKALIQQGQEDADNLLEFGPKENVKQGREALQVAALQLGRKLQVAKMRGADNIIRFRFISDDEYASTQERAKQRGAKIGATRRRKGR